MLRCVAKCRIRDVGTWSAIEALARAILPLRKWSRRMAKKTVLAIGIEPSLVDFSAFPGLTTELVTSYIKAQIEKLRAMGYEADSCLIDLGDTAEAVAAAA